jgi:glucose/arabinose dehydrogenase
VQAENSYDFGDATTPFEEINVIKAGGHYGWPYCYDFDKATPAWVRAAPMDCAGPAHTRPVALLPPHAAPLSALYYDGAMFPELKGKLLMSWHGWRATGARVVAFDVDAAGVPVATLRAGYPVYVTGSRTAKRVRYPLGPAAEPHVLTPGWGLIPGLRPHGMPVGLSVAPDGSIWIAEDKNGTIVRLARDRP